METQKLNVFIVDDNRLIVENLKNFIQHKLGDNVLISAFYDGESCLQKITDKIDVVILDYNLKGKNGLKILEEIKNLNPEIEVIIISNKKDIGLAIESFKVGALDYIIKGSHGWKTITEIIYLQDQLEL